VSFKRFITGIALVAMICSAGFAQDDIAQLVAKRDTKLASPFLKSAQWTTSYDEALAASKASGKLILGYFTRSYAPCGPCMQLEQTVLARPEFIEFAKDYVLFCHISTRIPSDAHSFLFAEKGGSAFPTLMVLNGDGNVLARQCGERSMRAVRDTVAEGQRFADLIHRAAPKPVGGGYAPGLGFWEVCSCDGDPEAQYDCLCRQIELGHLTPEEARTRIAALQNLSGDRRAFLESAAISCECAKALLEIRKAPDEVGQYHAAKRLVDMQKAGRVPSDKNVFPFWEWVMAYANYSQDVALYEDGLLAMKALLPNDGERLRDKEVTLDRMKREMRVGTTGILPAR
jgi:hypothetical protein